jgi:hypothetical protein
MRPAEVPGRERASLLDAADYVLDALVRSVWR